MYITAFQAVMDALLLVLLVAVITNARAHLLAYKDRTERVIMCIVMLVSLYGIIFVGLHFYYLFW